MNKLVSFVEKQQYDETKPMCHLVKAGDFLWLSGVVAFDEKGQISGPGDVQAQARQIFKNIQRRLKMVGADLPSIVRLTNYMTVSMEDMTLIRKYWEVRDEYFGNHRPASTGVQVAALMMPELVLEVDVIAYAPTITVGPEAYALNQ